MSTEDMEEFALDGEKVEIVRDVVFFGVKIGDSGFGKGYILRRLAYTLHFWRAVSTLLTTISTCRNRHFHELL